MTLLVRAELLLRHLEVEQEKLIQLYPKSEYGIKKLCSRLKIFINDGTFTAQAGDGVCQTRDGCFWPSGCSNSQRCREFGSCVAAYQNKHKDEIFKPLTPSTGMVADWLPMETAPLNENIWLANDHSIRVGFWLAGKKHECRGSVGGGWKDFALSEAQGSPMDLRFQPTKWQPTPRLNSPSRVEVEGE